MEVISNHVSKALKFVVAHWREAAVLVAVTMLFFAVAPRPLPDGNPSLDPWEQRIGETARDKAAASKSHNRIEEKKP